MTVQRKTGSSTRKAGGTRRASANGARTPRREETRRSLLDAASHLFAEQGYHATTVPEIVEAAGVGHGTFYEYFGNRRDILLALITEAVSAGRRRPQLKSEQVSERIRSEIFWYLSDHVDHLAISKVWHEASNFEPEVATLRRQERARRIEHVRRGIVAAGTRSDIDPTIAAAALTAMLEEFAHRWFIEGDGQGTDPSEVVSVAETLSTLWLSAIGFDSPRQPEAGHAEDR